VSEEKDRAEQKIKLLRLIQRIPIFNDLPMSTAKVILSMSTKHVLNEGDVLCKEGNDSNSVFILLQGKLSVRIQNSANVATINPVCTIGEIGVFTGEKRSATVFAMEKSSLFSLPKKSLDTLIDRDPAFGVRIMRKVIQELSARIAEDNIKIREFQHYILDRKNSKQVKDSTE